MSKITQNNWHHLTVEEPLYVTFEYVSNFLRRASDSQQTGTDGTSAASSYSFHTFQNAAVF